MKNTQQVARWALCAVAIIGIGWATIAWSHAQTTALNAWAERYEKCVLTEYEGWTPAAWHAETGEYPECPVEKY